MSAHMPLIPLPATDHGQSAAFKHFAGQKLVFSARISTRTSYIRPQQEPLSATTMISNAAILAALSTEPTLSPIVTTIKEPTYASLCQAQQQHTPMLPPFIPMAATEAMATLP
jgi:hypothetical protein